MPMLARFAVTFVAIVAVWAACSVLLAAAGSRTRENTSNKTKQEENTDEKIGKHS